MREEMKLGLSVSQNPVGQLMTISKLKECE